MSRYFALSWWRCDCIRPTTDSDSISRLLKAFDTVNKTIINNSDYISRLLKPFDTVNKTIMLRKLDRYGFRNDANDFWIVIWVTGRCMWTELPWLYKDYKHCIGLPQGSATSPWLFSLYHVHQLNQQDIRQT